MTRTQAELKIKVESTDEYFDEVLAEVERIESGEEPEEPAQVLSLPDDDALSRVLSSGNLELLRTITTEEPGSVRKLARLVDRDIKNVSTAVNELEELGLIEFEREGRAKRPTVWYDEINVQYKLRPLEA